MNRIKRCFCIFMAMTVLLATPVFAQEEASARASSYFLRSSVYLSELTTYTFRAYFEVTALRPMDELGASEIRIQRSLDGQNWTTVKTFSMEDYPDLVDEDQVTHVAYVTYTGTKGYYYRARVVLYAKDSSGMAEMTEYTSKILIGG